MQEVLVARETAENHRADFSTFACAGRYLHEDLLHSLARPTEVGALHVRSQDLEAHGTLYGTRKYPPSPQLPVTEVSADTSSHPIVCKDFVYEAYSYAKWWSVTRVQMQSKHA